MALSGVRVLDLSQLAPGPYCTMLLGDLGADVLVIENVRDAPSDAERRTAAYFAFQRNKRSLRLNLKHPDGLQIFKALARDADVVVEGFRPGVVDRLGIGYEALRAENPRIVYCSISGYGQDGPYSKMAGHDLNYAAVAGVLGMIGRPGSPPAIPMNFLADYGGGSLMAAYGLLGWGLTMTLAATLLILAAVPAVIRKEPPPPLASEQRRKRGERPSLIRALKRRDSRYIIPFLFAFGYAGTFMGGLFSPFLVHMGVPLPSIGGILPVAGLIGGTGTALLTPILVKRVGLRGAGIVGMCFLPIEGLTFAWLSYRGELPGFLTLIALCSALFFSTGIYGYAVSISRFRWASKAQAGTDYSLQSSLWNLGVYAGGAVAGFVAEWYGYTVYYIIAAGVATAFALCYVLMFNYVERLVQVREAAETEDVAPFDAVEAV